MKIKNVVVGGYIQSKKDSKQLIAGHCYQVADKDTFDKTVRLTSIDDSFDDSLWFCVSDFRKQRPQPQLKQLDQSVFDGLDEGWRFAAVDGNKGFPIVYEFEPYAFESGKYYSNRHGLYKDLTHLTGYDASNWQNSLIERDIAKELLEVDLSSELTGSDLCRAMLARGDKFVMCAVSMADDETALSAETVTLNRIVISLDKEWLYTDTGTRWHYAIPINNQGEPLTAAEAGF